MEKELSLEFLRVVERAAIASAHTMGLGDRHKSDHMAVEAMRSEMDTVHMDGTIVIGEGERDEAPMLFIGEKVGAAAKDKSRKYPEVVIAVDPLEGTNLCATGEPNAIVVLAASEPGGLLHAPDLYMEKIIVGPSCKGAVDLDAPPADNLRAIADRLHIPVIASGGAGGAAHFFEIFREGHADAALAASIFHYGISSIGDLKQHLLAQNIPVRWPC